MGLGRIRGLIWSRDQIWGWVWDRGWVWSRDRIWSQCRVCGRELRLAVALALVAGWLVLELVGEG